MIAGFRFNLALGATRFGAADRGHARRLWSAWWREGRRLRAIAATATLGVTRFTFAALLGTLVGATRRTRFALTPRLAFPPRFTFTPRLAAAARSFARTML